MNCGNPLKQTITQLLKICRNRFIDVDLLLHQTEVPKIVTLVSTYLHKYRITSEFYLLFPYMHLEYFSTINF